MIDENRYKMKDIDNNNRRILDEQGKRLAWILFNTQ